MTNTFANDIARWLATNPGLFKGSSKEDVLGRAYAECPVRAPSQDRSEQIKYFGETLKMLGHDVRYVNAFDAAGVPLQGQGHWQLPLPEKPRAAPRMDDESKGRRRG